MATWWVGGYGHDMGGTMPGIQAMRTTDAGALELVGTAVEALSPSFLLRRGDRLHAVAEGGGTIETFRRAGEHSLVHEGSVPSGGRWPCKLDLFAGGIAVANYFDGTVALIDPDRGELLQVEQLTGSGPHERQQSSHAHSVLAIDDDTLLSVDLGSDRVTAHDRTLAAVASVALPPGTGPRDIVRTASGVFYVLSELSNELFVLRWADRALEIVSSVAVPGALEGDTGSAISMHGSFVYTGIRGSNRISMLRASDDGASLEPLGWFSSEGEWPRHHVAADGVLHVANQHSNSVASFRLADDGAATLIAEPTAVPSPNYLLADA